MPKIDRASRARRSGVVITSTIALALGGAAIVAPSTAAAESVRYDGEDPVAPKQSELNSTTLTCGATLTNAVSSNSGLSYERRVPGMANGTDRNFGLQVTADTSGERTFNFLNVVDGPNNPPISGRTVKLPPLQPGDTIGPPATGTVNYVDGVPDMVIEPPARGQTAREFRTNMDLTGGQVDQIANGGMTIGWKGQYNADWSADNKYFFSDSGKFLVNGVVNPWPSENADCTPITIDWADQLDTEKDNYEATVINPGVEVKVGTVSADDDSLERLRFTAKDPDGNVVPGEITREGNDIYWTMADYIEGQPAYTQTDKLKFEMIAMPRDLEGLQKAAEENGSLPDTVYNSSLTPERYRSPETIATNTFDIDDAKNHDPNYDSRQQNITSGVADKAPTEGRQTRTFANVADSNGDTLADLVEKYNAEIELDDSNVYEGWDAYFRDPANGDYTVVVESPAGTDARPGSFAQPIVKVTYSNGTQDIIPLLVIVDPNNTQTTEVIYPPATIRGKIGEGMTSEAPTLKRVIGKNQKPVKPASYTVDPATVPAGWTIKVAEDGTVTATSPADAKAGDKASPKIIATYPDGTIDDPELTFLVGSDESIYDPSYPVEVTKPEAPVTHQIQNVPEGSKFALNATDVDGWTYSIDPDTGAVTVTPPAGAQGGDRKVNTVTVTYPDGTTEVVPVDTIVAHSFNYEAEVQYPEETAYPGDNITSPLNVDKPDEVGYHPETPFAIVPGANFTATGKNNEFGNPTYTVSTPNGDWTVSLDDEGNVISQIPETAKDGDTVSVPVRVTYEDGSYDDTTAVVNVKQPTRQVPFDVKYEFDPTLAAGTYEVATEGDPGDEYQLSNGTWKRTKEPTNEVVRVGTKPATASKDVSWTAPIPYSTTTRPNSELAPGEQKVVQQGVNGERTYTAKFTSTGDQAAVVETEDTKDPVEEIIEYGPRLDDQELVTETTRKIPFDTQIIPDDTLAAGEQVVDKQGVVGEETVTSKQKLVDGKPAGNPVVETTIVTEKQDAVIRVGTKTEGSNTVEHTEPVPYETKVEYDPTLAAGEYEVVTPGQAGEKTVKVTQTIVNSKVTDTQREETVTSQPTTEVIKVGTKQATATDKVEWKEPIPFSTIVRPNPDLKPGEVVTVQEGVNGEATYTATFEGTNGEATVTESKDRTEPTQQIIEYGPSIDDQTLTTTTTNPVPFNTTFVADPNLPVGQQEVEKQGENGVDTITSVQEIKDGKPVGKPKVTTERTKEPVDAVVRVGTKTEGQTVHSVETVIPFEVEVVYDPTLAPGEQKVTQEGVPGTKKVTVTQPVVNSQPDGEATTTEEIVKEPTKKIIAVGTKPAEASNQVSWTVDTPYKTVVRPNTELKPGEVKTVQEGEYGEKTYTADFKSVGADSTVTPTEEQTKAPKDQIVEYGPTIDDQTLTSTTTNPVPFNTTFVADPTLAVGEQVVDKQGENGVDTITSTQEIKDGKPVGEPKVTTERTKEPVDAVVRVGTKTDSANAFEYTEPVPYETKIEYDPTLAAGEYKVVTPGKAGEKTVKVTQTIVNSEVTDTQREENVSTQPTTEVIKVGTKQATATEKVEWTEPIPFSTVVRPNPDLKPGEVKTVQEGVNGEATYTATFEGTNGEATVTELKDRTEPTDKIVEYGPGADDANLISVVNRPVPFETTVILDETLPVGEQVVEKQGVLGEEKVTTTRELIDGKLTEPEVTTERTKEPVNAVIRVGTKVEAPKSASTDIEVPQKTEVIFDTSLEPGQEEVVSEGEPGLVRVTTVNGATSMETVREAKPRIIRVGAKEGEKPTWNEMIPFGVITRENPKLPAGTHKRVVEGKAGLARHVGDEVEILRPATDEVIEVGTGIVNGELRDTTVSPVEYEVEFLEDDSLPVGAYVVQQQGVFGETRTTKSWTFENGQKQGEPRESTEQTKTPQNMIVRVGTKVSSPAPSYDPGLVNVGNSVTAEINSGHNEGNAYELGGEVPEGWTVEVDPETGAVTATPPATAKSGETVQIPVRVTTPTGESYVVNAVMGVLEGAKTEDPGTDPEPDQPAPKPDEDPEDDATGSSDKAKRCVTNAFAKNSPILWLLPVGILAGIGYGVNEAFGPQIQQISAEVNARFQESMPDLGFGHGRNNPQPEWARELQMKADAVNRQFATYGEQLQPLGIALGAVAAISLTGVLIAQACQEEGFDNGMTVLGSTERVTSSGETGSSSSKGSSENAGSSSK